MEEELDRQYEAAINQAYPLHRPSMMMRDGRAAPTLYLPMICKKCGNVAVINVYLGVPKCMCTKQGEFMEHEG